MSSLDNMKKAKDSVLNLERISANNKRRICVNEWSSAFTGLPIANNRSQPFQARLEKNAGAAQGFQRKRTGSPAFCLCLLKEKNELFSNPFFAGLLACVV